VAVLACRGISKRYASVQAVRGASFEAGAGEIHAVVGENGAGKSTLLKIAAGLVSPDEGEVVIDGRALTPHTPREALARGVAMVQQHFALVGVMTALENVVLGAEPLRSFGRLDLARARDKVESLARELGSPIALDAVVDSLGVGERQRIEIVRALFRDARVLILDEPSSVLAPQEADALYRALRRLAERGRTIVVVTHKLGEVRAYADAATAMRRGEVVCRKDRTGGVPIDTDALAEAIMGSNQPPSLVRAARQLGHVVLSAKDVTVARALDSLDLELRAHEVIGVAGVEGNGQRELVQVLAGDLNPERGRVHIEGGRPVVVYEDRQVEGLVLDATVRDNLLLGDLRYFARLGVLDAAAMEKAARERMRRGGIRPPDLELPARALSGGNQQKIVVARALSRQSQLLILAHPTRGVDLGAARDIHAQILDAASAGVGVLVISSDLLELRALADRILVLRRGRFVASFGPEARDADIGAAMLGGDARAAEVA
jgi:general nucleoside transport system ATP-binding protein